MNNINNYLQELLVSQNLTEEQEETLQSHKEEVTSFLRAKFGDSPKIKYAGSKEKGTMIRDNYDLDIVCYFPSTDERTLKEIREDVSDHLGEKYMMEDKASAERILDLKDSNSPRGYHIDVVPGRFIEGTNDVFLHLAEGDKERLQTNLKTHISHIANSGCVPVIRLAKIWAHRNKIEIKTFILELFIVEILNDSKTKDDLEKSFLIVIEAMKDRFNSIQIIDPANTNNIVSKLMEPTAKTAVVYAAEGAYEQIEDSNNLSDWKSIFCDTSKENITPVVIENSRDLALSDFSHRQDLSDEGIVDYGTYPCSVEIKAEIWFRGPHDKKINRRSHGFVNSKTLIPTWHEIDYTATTDAPMPYDIYWQVVNTGMHASQKNGLRGEIFPGERVRTEHTLFHGVHWIECFIVSKEGVCIARSGPFYVAFRNPNFLQLPS
ncbi:MAG: nucleotidyltransferase domain-containing protein [Candidatus Pacebacteria bacterium]|nr:nucleotidyltransferase domain-containing protein [Candidatus Paceibacterota bacterium]